MCAGPLRNGRLSAGGVFGVVSEVGRDGILRLVVRDQLIVFWDLKETYATLECACNVSTCEEPLSACSQAGSFIVPRHTVENSVGESDCC